MSWISCLLDRRSFAFACRVHHLQKSVRVGKSVQSKISWPGRPPAQSEDMIISEERLPHEAQLPPSCISDLVKVPIVAFLSHSLHHCHLQALSLHSTSLLVFFVCTVFCAFCFAPFAIVFLEYPFTSTQAKSFSVDNGVSSCSRRCNDKSIHDFFSALGRAAC